MKTRVHFPTFFVFSLLFFFAASTVYAAECSEPAEPTFIVRLPPAPEYASDPSMLVDYIEIPNGRPIYALFVHGYTQNWYFNQFLCYNFAKRLMEDGAYVHYAWWNNLCAEYMARPLHQHDSHPGYLGLWGTLSGAVLPHHKAIPPNDFQFQSDAERLLLAIRENNPSAMIIIVGHSMGGAAVARLGSNTTVVIDILAPIDPVENRSSPWIDLGEPFHNYTRYRIAHEDLEVIPPPYPDRRTFGSNVINLYHRYQKEAVFPMDYQYDVHFLHNPPPGGSTSQMIQATCNSLLPGSDPGGYYDRCHTIDGHGEIVGFRGNPDLANHIFESHALGLEAQGDWPRGRTGTDICRRRRLLMEMPHADYRDDWKHRPYNPNLCLVSPGLIELYETMNRPPVADAGGDRTVAHTTSGVTLDGSASTDPDGDDLRYTWRGMLWETDGRVATVKLGLGTHEIILTVRDPSGHIDRDTFELTVVGGVDGELQLVTRMVGAHPNPFNFTTQVVFELAERQRISLQIFDLQGHLVRTLEEGTFDPGRYERAWNSCNDAGRTVSSGLYFVRMRAGDRAEFSKILLLK